jgi:CheY-like chemotaxis protein
MYAITETAGCRGQPGMHGAQDRSLHVLKAEVRPVGESEKAAAMVNQEKFDGIFLDLEMPTLSRFDLARLIRKSSWNKSTPIVKVTGSAERKTMQDAFAIGETFFIQSPWTGRS